jgi:hypothetical protein
LRSFGWRFPIKYLLNCSGIWHFLTWPNQFGLWALMWLIIFLCFISLSNSSLVLTIYVRFYFVGPNILLKIFLSKSNNFWIMASEASGQFPKFCKHA